MDLMRIFSLKTRPTFFLLVAVLCLFSVGAWWSVRTLVWSEVASRLAFRTDRIESSIRELLSIHENNLVHLRAHFPQQGEPGREEFRRLVERMGLFARHPGIRGLGYAAKIKHEELPHFTN